MDRVSARREDAKEASIRKATPSPGTGGRGEGDFEHKTPLFDIPRDAFLGTLRFPALLRFLPVACENSPPRRHGGAFDLYVCMEMLTARI